MPIITNTLLAIGILAVIVFGIVMLLRKEPPVLRDRVGHDCPTGKTWICDKKTGVCRCV